jgi:pimeloyl-ACP methyl ester carboxylesterase
LLALSNPRLLRSLVLIDPVIQFSTSGIGPAAASTNRRDIWDSRASAAEKFAKSKFYQAWDPRVLDLWIKHGLRDLPTAIYPQAEGSSSTDTDKRVTLTTSKHQELFTFLRPTYRGDQFGGLPDFRDPVSGARKPSAQMRYPFYRPEPLQAFSRLPELRPSVLYVFGETSDMSTPEARRAKMEATGSGVGGSGGAAEGRVKEVVLDCGHLVAMERVPQCAEAIVGFLGPELELWRGEQKKFRELRARVSGRELVMVDEQWKRMIKPKI